MTTQLAPSVPVTPGAPLRLEVDPSAMHFFARHAKRGLYG